jgi:glucosylglycerate synthase
MMKEPPIAIEPGVPGPEPAVLPDDFLRQLTAAGEVDILLFVPSLNNRDTIGHVMNALQLGLVKYFPRERTAVLNADGGSHDGTPQAVRESIIKDFRAFLSANPLRTMHRITAAYDSRKGPWGAMELLLSAAELMRAKACAVVSPDLQSISPEWVESLVRPIRREEFGFVAPTYHRHKYGGLLIKNLIAPVFRAAYGFRIREPMGSEFAFSGQLASRLLESGGWQQRYCEVGPAMGLMAAAIANDYRICQSFLGPRIYQSRHQEPDLVRVFQESVGALFQGLEADHAYWANRDGSSQVPTFGFEYSVALQPVRVSRKRLLQSFRLGVEELGAILEAILAPDTLRAVQDLAKLSDGAFQFPDELWVRVVYEFAASYHRSVLTRDHLLQALLPLYRGKVFSFVAETERATTAEVENRLEELCLACERLKPYLIERWSQEK